MLYFLGYYENGSYTASFNNAVFSELDARSINYVKLTPYNWDSPSDSIEFCSKIESSDDDIWFMGWAQTPIIEVIKEKKGKKYGFVVGTTANPFEPANIWKININERYRLGLYDKVFTISDWCSNTIIKAYPEINDKVVSVGFPTDFTILDQYSCAGKQPNLIVFNQRFSVEKLPLIEIELARRLISIGYTVRHLSGQSREALSAQSSVTSALLDLMTGIGMEFIYNPTKEEYFRQLSKASTIINTSMSDTLSNCTIEAMYLGAVPIAPRAFGFPEYIHSDNLYSPYHLDEIIKIALKNPERQHDIMKYSKDVVVDKFLKGMDIK